MTDTAVRPMGRRLMGGAFDLSGVTNASEARAAAGLAWEATHRPLFVDMPATDGQEIGDMILVEKERAVVRSDNGAMFGVVGREHKILSNEDFFDFADLLLAEAGQTWASADPVGGSLGGGKQPFLALQLGEGVQVAGVDAVGNAVLLSNGHVGNTAFTVTVNPLRLACGNQVRASIRSGKKASLFAHSVQHSGDLDAKMAEVRAALAMTSDYMTEFAALADRMAAVDFGLSEFNDFLGELLPIAEDAGDRAKATNEAQRDTFRHNWLHTNTLAQDLKLTTWGALNVVTEVLDHGELDVRKSKVPAAERRMRSVQFGAAAGMRDRAYRILAGV